MSDPKREGEWMVCGVCGFSLLYNRDRVPQWFHLAEVEDHLGVPVASQEIQFNTRCDFCYAEPAPLMVLSRDFDLPFEAGRSIGAWAACEHCGDLVKRGRWNDLVTYVKRQGPEATRRFPRKHFIAVYDRLRDHLYDVITADEWMLRNNFQIPGPEVRTEGNDDGTHGAGGDVGDGGGR